MHYFYNAVTNPLNVLLSSKDLEEARSLYLKARYLWYDYDLHIGVILHQCS